MKKNLKKCWNKINFMLSKQEVKKISALARIGLSDKEIEKYQEDLSAVLDWIEQLKEVDVSGVEAAAHITGLKNISRKDKIADFENKKAIIKLFPESKDNYDKVKSVL